MQTKYEKGNEVLIIDSIKDEVYYRTFRGGVLLGLWRMNSKVFFKKVEEWLERAVGEKA